MNKQLKSFFGISFTCIVLAIFICLGLVVFSSLYSRLKSQSQAATASLPTLTVSASVTQPAIAPTQTSTLTQATATPHLDQSDADLTLKTLKGIQIKVNDPITLTERLKGLTNVAGTLAAPTTPLTIGAKESFWIQNQDTNQYLQVQATLRFIGPHLYFWIQDGVNYNPNDLTNLGNTFETIYTTDRDFFGSEWTPGIDDDVHLYALYTRGMGNSVAGYFSSQDEYPKLVFKYSNEHEMFDLNADVESISDLYIYSTMAHEFQHMIHWNLDRNENSWLDEGFSVLAQFINGYTVGGFDTSFTLAPNTQLNDWSLDESGNAPHYGAAFLYLDYILSRFGSAVTQAIVKSPLHGLESIDSVFQSLGITDSQTHKTVSADDLFADWVIANYLENSSVGDGRYAYSNYPKAPKTAATQSIKTCPLSSTQGQVDQYGTQYIRITCQGTYTLTFTGATTVPLAPTQAFSGTYDFWSNKGDQSDMTLTRAFDFTSTQAPISFTYETWYDLEKNYDFTYLEASTDGTHWTVISTPSCTSDSSYGSDYGCGYTGSSGKWIKETVDLSAYAGQKIQLRFEYLTDAALNGEGFLLDDVSIPQINYSSDFEKDDGGWTADGFARVQNILPQTFRVSLIAEGKTTTVEPITLDAGQSASLSITIGGQVQDDVLVISGTTRFTRQPASYQISISK